MTGSTRSDSSGHSPISLDLVQRKITTTDDEPAVIDTPLPYGICSIECSASSTTALQAGETYDPTKAFGQPAEPAEHAAARPLARSEVS